MTASHKGLKLTNSIAMRYRSGTCENTDVSTGIPTTILLYVSNRCRHGCVPGGKAPWGGRAAPGHDAVCANAAVSLCNPALWLVLARPAGRWQTPSVCWNCPHPAQKNFFLNGGFFFISDTRVSFHLKITLKNSNYTKYPNS